MSRLAVLILVFGISSVARAAPVSLRHEGYLLGAGDLPMTDAAASLRFRIYPTQASPSAAYDATCTTAVSQGYYSVVLGSDCGGALDSAILPPQQAAWLEVTVGTTVLAPRVSLVAAPGAVYAAHALDADRLGGIAATTLVDSATGKLVGSALPLGTGLSVVGSSVIVAYGTTATTAVRGDDSRVVNALQTGASAGGDLGSTYPNPSVLALRGRAISTTAPTNGQVLAWSSGASEWAPANAAGNAALQASFTIGAPSASTVPVRVALKNGAGVALTRQTVVDVWLSDQSNGRQSNAFAAPSNFYTAKDAVAGVTNGWPSPGLNTSSARTIISNADGTFDVGVNHASSYDAYLNVHLSDDSIATSSVVHLASASSYATAVLADNPVAYYRTDELSGTTMIDQIAPGTNNGTYAGSPTLGVAGATTGSTAVDFHTTGKSATIPAVAALHPASTSFSLEVWFKFFGGAANGNIIDFGLNDFCIVAGGPNSFLALGKDTGAGASNSIAYINNAPNDTTTWHHLVVTHAGNTATDGRMFIDGVEVTYVGQFAQTITPNTGAAIVVGRTQAAASNYFNGMLDEIAIYNTVLSPARILAHYNAR